MNLADIDIEAEMQALYEQNCVAQSYALAWFGAAMSYLKMLNEGAAVVAVQDERDSLARNICIVLESWEPPFCRWVN